MLPPRHHAVPLSSNSYQPLYSPMASIHSGTSNVPFTPSGFPPLVPYQPQPPTYPGQFVTTTPFSSYTFGSPNSAAGHPNQNQPNFVNQEYMPYPTASLRPTKIEQTDPTWSPVPMSNNLPPFQAQPYYTGQPQTAPQSGQAPWYHSGDNEARPSSMNATTPSTMQQQQNSYTPTPRNQQFPPQDHNAAKKTRFFMQKVKCLSHKQTCSQLPLMPVNIDNGFPNLTLSLGAQGSHVELTGLFDTCGSLNTGHLSFHLYIAAQNPEVVHSLRFFNSDDPFEPIKLEGAVSDPTDYDASRHGLLTAVIQYKTPYMTTKGHQISLSIALGSEVSTNTIFGLPTLSAFEFHLDMKTLSAFSPTVHETFQLTRAAGSLGLPAGAQFDLDDLRRQYEAAKVGLIVDNNAGRTRTEATTPGTAEPAYVGIDDFS